ncbi:hypothetical protein [Paenibacillus sp. SYP-B4298]|uniref:hypothetical protein n=1 Tax=Paenibacillus sp. SYP-B4298 TaxID=2996034 RepID=UPI0022DE2FE5|nr:hypothetical protein [Paenibacillus sp. SYP-B4298]
MKSASVIGILLLTAAILFVELRSASRKQERVVAASITVVASLLALALVFNPQLPGPSQFVALLFGWLDQQLDMH